MSERIKQLFSDKRFFIPIGIAATIVMFVGGASYKVGQTIGSHSVEQNFSQSQISEMKDVVEDSKRQFLSLQKSQNKKFNSIERTLSTIEGGLKDNWSTSDMERWSFRFDKENYAKGVLTPDPRLVKREAIN